MIIIKRSKNAKLRIFNFITLAIIALLYFYRYKFDFKFTVINYVLSSQIKRKKIRCHREYSGIEEVGREADIRFGGNERSESRALIPGFQRYIGRGMWVR